MIDDMTNPTGDEQTTEGAPAEETSTEAAPEEETATPSEDQAA